jgi:hypothetical protein
MRIRNLIIVFLAGMVVNHAMAQTEQTSPEKYRHFVIYVGAGPSYFFNNVVTFKDGVNPWGYEISARFMWEPRNSFLSLGFETGYFRIYSATASEPVNAKVTNSEVPLLFVVSMKFSKEIYANWSMGQSLQYNIVDAQNNPNNFNNHLVSLADFAATVGYRFKQKERISYAVELKGYYSSQYANGTIAILFIAGFKL